MKVVAAVLALVAVVVAEEFYDKKWDSFNAQELVENKRLLKNYANCFNDKGPCTSDAAVFKRIIPEALRTDCAKCSPKQRVLIRTVAKSMRQQFPEEWKQINQKQDPKGEYQERLARFLSSTN